MWLLRSHARTQEGALLSSGLGSHPFSWPNLKTRLRVPIAQLPYMPFLVAAGDQSTVTNVQAACDIDEAVCCLAPSSFSIVFAAKDPFGCYRPLVG